MLLFNFTFIVAIVVTIVVLLILAGITITYVMGDNSIFKKAQEAASKINQAKQEETEGLDKADDFIKKKTNKKPNIKWAGVTSKTIHSLTIEAVATDEDKDKLTYKLYIGTSKEELTLHSEEKQGTSNESVQWEILDLQEYTKYYYKIEVTDGIDTVTTTIKEVMTNRTNTAPTVANTQIEAKTTNSMTIKANATDTEKDKLTYTIYFGETADTLTKQATIEEKNKGEGITFPKADLKEYTLYYYKIDVSDEWDTTEGTVQEVRTYCNGGGSTCSGAATCVHCSGRGTCSFRQVTSTSTENQVWCSDCRTTVTVTIKEYRCPACNVGRGRTRVCAKGHTLESTNYPSKCVFCTNGKTPCSHNMDEPHEVCPHNKVGMHDK